MSKILGMALVITVGLSPGPSLAAHAYSVQELREDCNPSGGPALSICIAYLTAVDDLAIAWARLVHHEPPNVRYAGGYRWCPPADLDFVQWARLTYEEIKPISGMVDRPAYLYVGMAAQRAWPCPASSAK
jgi:hypothetical protein